MQAVFVSKHFEDPDRDLLKAIERLIESHGLLILHGDELGGNAISPEVQKRIEAADACVAIATPREKRPDGRYRTHPWVQNEIVMARTLKKRCVAVLEKSVALDGAFTENEYIAYDPARPLPALTALAGTIGLWRREAGRQMKVLVLPPSVAKVLARDADRADCQYRYYDARGKAGGWQQAAIVPQQGGPVVYLDGARDDCLVELRVKVGTQSWCSVATAAFPNIELRKETRR